jgi:hypothetical protein
VGEARAGRIPLGEPVAEIPDSPIPPQVLYLAGLVVSLSVVSLGVLGLLNALGQGDRAQAWIAASYFVAASLLAALCFWRLF